MKDPTNSAVAEEDQIDSAGPPRTEPSSAEKPLSEDASLEIEALSAMIGTAPRKNRIDKKPEIKG